MDYNTHMHCSNATKELALESFLSKKKSDKRLKEFNEMSATFLQGRYV